MASVELRSIEKNYGPVKVIKGIDLSVDEGEFVALVGPSGCGKSTLLRMIAGLEEITEGEISIGEKVVNDLTPRERNIAMVFQSYALYPHMSVAKNMSFNLELSRVPKDEINTRVKEAARMLELEDLLERQPSQLSGGQRQRVAMGRAIVRNPSVFLFDEPLSNLDAKLRVQMRGEIKTLHKKVATTSIYVTHDQVEAMTLADRVVVLDAGVIQQAGTPMELYLRPSNLFVAGFIGSPAMNFLEGELVSASAGLKARIGDGIELGFNAGPKAKSGMRVVIGVRPEHLTLEGSDNPLTGSIVYVEPTGGQTYFHLDLGTSQVTVGISGVTDLRDEGSMTVHVAPDLVHVFDETTTERVSA
jgi:multiple sugar transport system ATP-binding protein